MTRQTPFWTDERVEKLRSMRAQGKSCSEVGRVLGCSRCAVQGKAWRLGLSLSAAPYEPRIKAVASVPKDVAKPLPLPRNASTGSARTAVLGLDKHTCRFPSGDPRLSDFSFCMKPSPIYGYCSEHRELAYQAVRPRVR